MKQDDIRTGAEKLAQFVAAMKLRGVSPLYGQTKGEDAMAYVRLFDPCGSWVRYVSEFNEIAPDGTPNLAFGLVIGHVPEFGDI